MSAAATLVLNQEGEKDKMGGERETGYFRLRQGKYRTMYLCKWLMSFLENIVDTNGYSISVRRSIRTFLLETFHLKINTIRNDATKNYSNLERRRSAIVVIARQPMHTGTYINSDIKKTFYVITLW